MTESSSLEQGIAELLAYHRSTELFVRLEHLAAAKLLFLKGTSELLPADTEQRIAEHLANAYTELDAEVARWLMSIMTVCRLQGILATFRECEDQIRDGFMPYLNELRATDAVQRGQSALDDPVNAWFDQVGLLIDRLPRSLRKRCVSFLKIFPDARTVVTQPMTALHRQIRAARDLQKHVKTGPLGLIAQTHYWLGELLTIAGMRDAGSDAMDQAIDEYNALLCLAQEDMWPWFVAKARAALGRALAYKGSRDWDKLALERAIAAIGPALIILPIPSEHWGAADLSLADAYLQLGRIVNNVQLIVAAGQAYMHAKEDGDLIGDPLIQGMALVGLAESRTDEALYFKDTRALADVISICNAARQSIPLSPGTTPYRTRADAALIRCHFGLYQLTNDLAWLKPMADFLPEMERSWKEASIPEEFVLVNTAAWALDLGGRVGSEVLVGQAAGIFESVLIHSRAKPGDPTWFNLNNDLASAWLKLGELRSDKDLILKALDGFELNGSAPAEEHAIHMRAWFGRSNALLVLSKLEQDRAKLLAARDGFTECLRLITPESNPEDYLSAGSSLSHIYLRLEDWQAAVTRIDELLPFALNFVLSAHSPLAELDTTTTISALDDMLAYALLRLNRFDEALAASQQGRALTLQRLAAFESMGVETRDLFRNAMSDWRSSREQKQRGRTANPGDLMKMDAAVGEKFERIKTLISSVAPVASVLGVAEVSQALPPGGVAVVPVVTESGGALILFGQGATTVTADDVIWLDSLTWTSIRSLVFAKNLEEGTSTAGWPWSVAYNRFVEELRRGGGYFGETTLNDWDATIQTAADALWDLLMGALDTSLRSRQVVSGAEILIVIPALLSPLPLHAARTRTSSGWRYFVDEWALTTAPSLSAYNLSCRRRRQRRQAPASLLQVIDPRGDFGANPIPIVQGFASRTSLTGPVATVENVLRELPLHSHLFFYCHGSWDSWHPEDSGLLMAAGGRLTVRELRNAVAESGRAALLGACDTALAGLNVAPDEFVGFPAALLEAGLPGVAASLWAVASGPTLLLCDRLLRNLSAPDVSLATALREAQLWLRDTQGYREPYFWASFTAMGV